jgi:hypothetical protein
MTIPKTHYKVGETAEAVMTLTYIGNTQAEFSSPGGEYFDIMIKDEQNNFLYFWRKEKYPAGSLRGIIPMVSETINPGWSVTRSVPFKVQKGGTLYVYGLNFNDGFAYSTGISYTPGGGRFGVNISTPPFIINVR